MNQIFKLILEEYKDCVYDAINNNILIEIDNRIDEIVNECNSCIDLSKRLVSKDILYSYRRTTYDFMTIYMFIYESIMHRVDYIIMYELMIISLLRFYITNSNELDNFISSQIGPFRYMFRYSPYKNECVSFKNIGDILFITDKKYLRNEIEKIHQKKYIEMYQEMNQESVNSFIVKYGLIKLHLKGITSQ